MLPIALPVKLRFPLLVTDPDYVPDADYNFWLGVFFVIVDAQGALADI